MFQVCHTMQVHKNLKWLVVTRRTSLNHRTVKIGGSCMHRNGYLLVYIYSSIRGKEQLIPCCQTQYILICTSLIPRPEEEEEEKGFDFSCLSMRLIAVEFHGNCILLTYFCTLVMLKLILRITLSVDLLAAYRM